MAAGYHKIARWASIPLYLKVIRIVCYMGWGILGLSIIGAGVIYAAGIGQPSYKSEVFSERYVIKGEVHYLTKIQSQIYISLRTISLISLPGVFLLFIVHNVMDKKIQDKLAGK